RWQELDAGAETVVLCHHGVRSAYVAAFLEQVGFSRVYNLVDGIDGWSREVDASVPRYGGGSTSTTTAALLVILRSRGHQAIMRPVAPSLDGTWPSRDRRGRCVASR